MRTIERLLICESCGQEVPAEDIYDYGGDQAHTVYPPLPYYSSESAGLPCGPIKKAWWVLGFCWSEYTWGARLMILRWKLIDRLTTAGRITTDE